MTSKKELLDAFERDLLIKRHAYDRIRRRGINLTKLEEAFKSDDIIEEYDDDFPLPSVLILGFDKTGKPLHIVCAPTSEGIIIITVYEPDPEMWEEGYKERKSEVSE